MKKIGIVGLGIMGTGMALNFLEKGYSVYVWNRTPEASKQIEQKGAVVCSTPADVAGQVDLLFEVTANDESSKAVWTGEMGILSGATRNTILITSATLSVKWVDELISICRDKGYQFFDMALTGGRIGAETGTLTLLCGGQETVLEEIKPVLAAIATKILYFGPAGQGMRYKLILNFLQATHIVGLGQALKIAKAHSMDLQKVGDALAERPGGVITNLAWRDYKIEPDPINFSIEWITKDLTYAKKLAVGLDVTLLDEVLTTYKEAVVQGYGKKDWASINTLDEKIIGTPHTHPSMLSDGDLL